MKRKVPSGTGKEVEQTYSNRQELEVLADRGVDKAIAKLTPLCLPEQYSYINYHFWLLLEYCGQDFTISELQDYCEVFAQNMSVPDKHLLFKLRNIVNDYIDEVKEGAG